MCRWCSNADLIMFLWQDRFPIPPTLIQDGDQKFCINLKLSFLLRDTTLSRRFRTSPDKTSFRVGLRSPRDVRLDYLLTQQQPILQPDSSIRMTTVTPSNSAIRPFSSLAVAPARPTLLDSFPAKPNKSSFPHVILGYGRLKNSTASSNLVRSSWKRRLLLPSLLPTDARSFWKMDGSSPALIR